MAPKSGWFRYVLPCALVALLGGCHAGSPVDPGDGEVPAVDPFEMNRRLGRGVNFGNALEAPVEGAWGVVLDSRHFERAAEAGFKTVRLPVRWSSHASAVAPYSIDAGFLARVAWAVDEALGEGLNVILNVHHYEEMATHPEAHRERWLALWKQISERFRSHSENLLFEPMNEPNGALSASLWNELVQEVVQVIRRSNPTRNLVVGPVNWNNTASLAHLRLPEDENLIATVHLYEPFRFTHQGAEWVEGSDAWLGTPWLGTDSDKAFVRSILDQAAAWGASHHRPILVGEFGAYERADMASRVRWTAFVARECEDRDMSWAYWEFMAGFGIYNRDNDTWKAALRDALLPPPPF